MDVGLFSEEVCLGPGTDSRSGLGERKASKGSLELSSLKYHTGDIATY